MQSTTTAAPKLFADANDDDRLIVIPPAEWAQLRDMYRRDWPTHIIGCYTLDTFVRWLEAAPVANLTVYSLNGEWRADGLYVCVVCKQSPRTPPHCSVSSSVAHSCLLPAASLPSVCQHIGQHNDNAGRFSASPAGTATAARLVSWLQSEHAVRSLSAGRAGYNEATPVYVRL